MLIRSSQITGGPRHRRGSRSDRLSPQVLWRRSRQERVRKCEGVGAAGRSTGAQQAIRTGTGRIGPLLAVTELALVPVAVVVVADIAPLGLRPGGFHILAVRFGGAVIDAELPSMTVALLDLVPAEKLLAGNRLRLPAILVALANHARVVRGAFLLPRPGVARPVLLEEVLACAAGMALRLGNRLAQATREPRASLATHATDCSRRGDRAHQQEGELELHHRSSSSVEMWRATHALACGGEREKKMRRGCLSRLLGGCFNFI